MTAPKPRPAATPKPQSVAMDLFDQPGHLLRRAHQIASGVFDDLVGPDVTPSQFAILRMVHEQPGIDQVSLARRIGLDTSTTALTAARLETRGLLDRSACEADRRLLALTLTQDGEAQLSATVSGVRRMRERLLSSLSPDERELFMRLLRKFVDINNEQSRAPLREADAEPEAHAKPPRGK
jgi:DNA-binding MarR family transcriptional regulator